VVRDFPDEDALLADIAVVRRERLTTLGRLIADPNVRHDFGFDFEDDQVIFHFAREDLLDGIRKIFADLAGEVGVSSIKSKEQRKDYIKQSADVLPARAARLDSPRQSGAPSVSTPSPPAPGNTASATSRRTMPRQERVIFQGLILSKVDLRTSKLLKQAQSVDIENLPGVAAVMVRVIVELAVTDAALNQGWTVKESDTLRKKIRFSLLKLDPNCENPRKRDKALDSVWVRSQDEEVGMTVQAMNSFVHHVMTNPTAGEVRELSRTYRVLLERLDQYLASNPKK
jgi:hypothetical protein